MAPMELGTGEPGTFDRVAGVAAGVTAFVEPAPGTANRVLNPAPGAPWRSGDVLDHTKAAAWPQDASGFGEYRVLILDRAENEGTKDVVDACIGERCGGRR